MDKQALEDVVGKAIRAASGKSFNEARELITSEVLALIESPVPEVFSIAPTEVQAQTDDIPPSVIRPASRITSLRPVVVPPPRSIVKQIWTAEQVQQFINNETPTELSFVPDGTDKEARLTRVITVDTNNPPTVQLSYRPNASDPDIPFPKVHLFTTDESWDWDSILAKMTRDAASMYRLRSGPIVTHKVSTGGRINFNKAEV